MGGCLALEDAGDEREAEAELLDEVDHVIVPEDADQRPERKGDPGHEVEPREHPCERESEGGGGREGGRERRSEGGKQRK